MFLGHASLQTCLSLAERGLGFALLENSLAASDDVDQRLQAQARAMQLQGTQQVEQRRMTAVNRQLPDMLATPTHLLHFEPPRALTSAPQL